MTHVLLAESNERDECPACEHPWHLHTDACCGQILCACTKGVFRAWALPPQEYVALGFGPAQPYPGGAK